ncbi:polyprenyl synthetase family protein [Streptomyces oryzae]|uniref:Polyprenyl synthetase family protein n=1 Tax=Streptomyces oryzae TaxID=1434886 RepID=A0ABS3X7Z3_9ACTN|nr:polyprenyl synthetase family protein [Streptomyces oryzae]MBO8191485.1 polyprenyl synthetase family protein [Streptomyces oryzae]
MTTAAGATPSELRVAQQMCERARRWTQPALREAVARLPGPLAAAGAYQFGWQHSYGPEGPGRASDEVDEVPEAASPAGADSGKAVRPALVYLAAEALGAPAERAVPGAVAVELVHNFTLVHDDITDGDATRRGRPALWRQFGVGPALLAGDGLHVLAMDALLRRRDERSAVAAALLNRALIATMYGQVRDLGFVQRPWAGPEAVSVAEYRAAARGKTGALLACAAALGAVLAGGLPRQVARFAAFGRHMGVAFQCADDILGLWGDRQRTGKPVGDDLLQARKTIPVLLALTADTPASARLRDLLTRAETPLNREALPGVLELIGEAGGEEATRREAEHQTALALRMLAAVPMSAETRARFAAMAAYLTRRGS